MWPSGAPGLGGGPRRPARLYQVIFDEAHHLEDIATEYFSPRLERLVGPSLGLPGRGRLPRLLSVVSSAWYPDRGALPGTGKTPGNWPGKPCRDAERPGPRRMLFFRPAGLAREGGRGRRLLATALPGGSARLGSGPAGGGGPGPAPGRSGRSLDKLLEFWEGPNAETPESEEGLTMRAPLRTSRLGGRFGADSGRRQSRPCLLVGRRPLPGHGRDRGHHGPAAGGSRFSPSLLANLDGAVFFSATLTAGGEFTFFRERLGLDLVPPGERMDSNWIHPLTTGGRYSWPPRQICPSRTTPLSPSQPPFSWLNCSGPRGAGPDPLHFLPRADRICDRLQPSLPKACVCSARAKRPAGRSRRVPTGRRRDPLRHGQFLGGRGRTGPGPVLRGPDAPAVSRAHRALAEARMERMAREGGSPFHRYSLPQAVIKLKQGFGRLVRRGDDSGAVVVLDRRLLTKPYGQVFRQALPRCDGVFRAGRGGAAEGGGVAGGVGDGGFEGAGGREGRPIAFS